MSKQTIYQKKHYEKLKRENPKKLIYKAAKRRAKMRNVEFDIELDDMPDIPEVCPVLGIKIFSSNNIVGPNSPSLDRINNSKGYVKGNIRIISHRANALKRDATVEEIRLIVEDMRRAKTNAICR